VRKPNLSNCSQKIGVARLDLPAKCRTTPFCNVWIIDPLKLEKACLENPGKIRTSVAGHRGEQTHCFHDRHIGGGNLGKCILFELGPQQRLPSTIYTSNNAGRRPSFPEYLRLENKALKRRQPAQPLLEHRCSDGPSGPAEPPVIGRLSIPGSRGYYIDGIIAGAMAIHLFASPRAEPASKTP
jgi:hypothetical protein